MGLCSVLCFSFSMFRYYYTNSPVFLFLNWNLFLAFVPWMLTCLLHFKPSLQKSKFLLGFIVVLWLLFFPNALYILTDLFHLHKGTLMPMWFDLILILAFAWTGLLYGFLSLFDLEKCLKQYWKPWMVSVGSLILLFMGSFGVYLGRFLRWNSWDVLSEPHRILYDITHRVIHPADHPRTWGMTLFMGIFLCMLYGSFKLIQARKHE